MSKYKRQAAPADVVKQARTKFSGDWRKVGKGVGKEQD